MLLTTSPSPLSQALVLLFFTVLVLVVHDVHSSHNKNAPKFGGPEVAPEPRDFIGDFLVVQHRSIFVKDNKRVRADNIDECVAILGKRRVNAGYFCAGYCYLVKTKPWDHQLLRIKYGRYIVRWASMKYALNYYLKHSEYLKNIDTDEKTLNFFLPCDVSFYDWNDSQKVNCIELPIDKSANALFRAERNPDVGRCVFNCPPETTSAPPKPTH